MIDVFFDVRNAIFFLELLVVFYSLNLTLLATGYFSPGCHGGADSAHHFGKPGRASFKILTWKKAQNPKDEVSSSKIDEMAKD